MANYVTVKLEGFAELGAKLRELGPKIEAKGLRGANFAGAKVIQQAAQRTTAFHDVTGQLRENILVFRRRSRRGTMTHAIGVRGKLKRYANTAENRAMRRVGKRYRDVAGPMYYARFLEFGTSKMQPHAFLRPAFLASTDASLEAIKEGLQRAIAEAVK